MQYLLEEAELAEEKEQEKVQEKGKVVQGKVVKNKQAGWSAACGSPVCTIQNTTQNIKKKIKSFQIEAIFALKAQDASQ